MAADVFLGLDVGDVRIGTALARSDVRIANPLTTLPNRPEIYQDIAALAKEHGVSAVVVGWPRGLEGQITSQTRIVEAFVENLRHVVDLPVHLQDEALTSRKAEAELRRRKQPFAKEEVDALAATYILEDYLTAKEGQRHHV